jgi:hypothetical protein
LSRVNSRSAVTKSSSASAEPARCCDRRVHGRERLERGRRAEVQHGRDGRIEGEAWRERRSNSATARCRAILGEEHSTSPR